MDKATCGETERMERLVQIVRNLQTGCTVHTGTTQTSRLANMCIVHHTKITHYVYLLPSSTQIDQPYRIAKITKRFTPSL